MVFEVGTATMMAAKGATKPLYEVMAESGLKFNPDAYIPPVKVTTQQLTEKCCHYLITHQHQFYGLTKIL